MYEKQTQRPGNLVDVSLQPPTDGPTNYQTSYKCGTPVIFMIRPKYLFTQRSKPPSCYHCPLAPVAGTTLGNPQIRTFSRLKPVYHYQALYHLIPDDTISPRPGLLLFARVPAQQCEQPAASPSWPKAGKLPCRWLLEQNTQLTAGIAVGFRPLCSNIMITNG